MCSWQSNVLLQTVAFVTFSHCGLPNEELQSLERSPSAMQLTALLPLTSHPLPDQAVYGESMGLEF